jgi:glyoxylase-like metal-dependent hydrolase (beta-lactamase superfamily II)
LRHDAAVFSRVENGVTCLLVKTDQGPVLVDTGFGTRDYLSPTRSMRFFLNLIRASRDVEETAFHQIERLGYQPQEIRHIIQTHLHLDHAGGLPAFPHAKVHVLKAEYANVMSHRGWPHLRVHRGQTGLKGRKPSMGLPKKGVDSPNFGGWGSSKCPVTSGSV